VYGRPCSDQGQYYRKGRVFIAPEKIQGDYLTDPKLENAPIPMFHLGMSAAADAARYAADHHGITGYEISYRPDKSVIAVVSYPNTVFIEAVGKTEAEALARALLKGLPDGS
jgi:hypothetical protein